MPDVPPEAYRETAIELLGGGIGFAALVVGTVLILWALGRCILWGMSFRTDKPKGTLALCAGLIVTFIWFLSRSAAPDIPSVIAQTGPPAVSWSATGGSGNDPAFTTATTGPDHVVLPSAVGGQVVTSWIVWYYTNGSPSGVSVQLEGAEDAAGSPTGAYTALTAATSPIASANPGTATGSFVIRLCCDYYPHVRLHVNTLSGGSSPKVFVRVFGYVGTTTAAGGGGGGGGPTGATGASGPSGPSGPSGGSGGGGSFTLVEEHTASGSADLEFVSCISSTYDDYQVELVSLVPATNNNDFWLQFSTNGGSTWDSTSGNYGTAIWTWIAVQGLPNGSSSDTKILLSQGASQVDSTATYGGLSGSFKIYNPLSSNYVRVIGHTSSENSADLIYDLGTIHAGSYRSGTAANAFRVLAASGNIASGTVRCYGLSH
jgi:hypothetical protein